MPVNYDIRPRIEKTEEMRGGDLLIVHRSGLHPHITPEVIHGDPTGDYSQHFFQTTPFSRGLTERLRRGGADSPRFL